MIPIKEVFAYVAPDGEGNEGLAGVEIPGAGWLPLAASTREGADLLLPVVQVLIKKIGKPIKLVKFSNREEIGTVL
jgi:hypothetical protein